MNCAPGSVRPAPWLHVLCSIIQERIGWRDRWKERSKWPALIPCVCRESSTLGKLFCRQVSVIDVAERVKEALLPALATQPPPRRWKKTLFQAPVQSLSLRIPFPPGSIALPVYIFAFSLHFPPLSLSREPTACNQDLVLANGEMR